MRQCRACGGSQQQGLLDITSMDRLPRTMPGRWEPCRWCGFTGEPFDGYLPVPPYVPPIQYAIGMTMTLVHTGPAAWLPAVPTPQEILLSAGIDLGLLS
jgi:hypothetical protein